MMLLLVPAMRANLSPAFHLIRFGHAGDSLPPPPLSLSLSPGFYVFCLDCYAYNPFFSRSRSPTPFRLLALAIPLLLLSGKEIWS